MTEPILELREVSVTHRAQGRAVTALPPVSLRVAPGAFVVITGPSGSGKTTLLNVLGLLQSPSAGQYLLGGHDTARLGEAGHSEARLRRFGFVFQSFRLLPGRTVLQNVLLPMELLGQPGARQREERARELLNAVGLSDRLEHLPAELSGGEAQRVAIARAQANRPEVLLADEPTGNLDRNNRDAVMELLLAARDGGSTVVMVTHDPELRAVADLQLNLLARETPATPAVSSLPTPGLPTPSRTTRAP